MKSIWIGPTTNDFVNGESYTIIFQSMTGKIFKDANDLEGKKDDRVMCYKQHGSGYLVLEREDVAGVFKPNILPNDFPPTPLERQIFNIQFV